MKSKNRNLSSKSGISLLSITIYVILFFTFSVVAIGVASTMNVNMIKSKGDVINNEQFEKLQYNFIKSADSSYNIKVEGAKVTFSKIDSTTDVYTYDSTKKVVKRNDAIVARNVEEFTIYSADNVGQVVNKNGVNYTNNFDPDIDKVAVKVKFMKYNSIKESDIFVAAGEF